MPVHDGSSAHLVHHQDRCLQAGEVKQVSNAQRRHQNGPSQHGHMSTDCAARLKRSWSPSSFNSCKTCVTLNGETRRHLACAYSHRRARPWRRQSRAPLAHHRRRYVIQSSITNPDLARVLTELLDEHGRAAEGNASCATRFRRECRMSRA